MALDSQGTVHTTPKLNSQWISIGGQQKLEIQFSFPKTDSAKTTVTMAVVFYLLAIVKTFGRME